MPKPAKPSDALLRLLGRGEIDTSNESAPSQQIALASPSFASSECTISSVFKQKQSSLKCLTPGF
jgi:hypothetical protein